MADNAEFISLLNTALPTNRDPRADGAAEIRAVKTAVKNCFPNVDAPVTATAAQMNNIFNQGMSVGMIVMWSGPEDKVPEGWALCDGTISNNQPTPDLRGKFVMGWNPTRSGVEPEDIVAIGDKSALDSHYDLDLSKYLTSEPHTLTVAQLPEIEVGMYNKDGEGVSLFSNSASDGKGRQVYSWDKYSINDKITLKTSNAKGDAHKHSLVAAAEGKNKFDKRPNWYALAFIMYVGSGAL